MNKIGYIGYILPAFTAAASSDASDSTGVSWPTFHNPFKCNAKLNSPNNFDPAGASGTWYMHESTQYNKEKFGCV